MLPCIQRKALLNHRETHDNIQLLLQNYTENSTIAVSCTLCLFIRLFNVFSAGQCKITVPLSKKTNLQEMHSPSSSTPFLWIWKQDISVIRKRRQPNTVTCSVMADDTGVYSKELIWIDQV